MVINYNEADNPRRGNAMDIDMSDEGPPTVPEEAANWPWSDSSLVSSVPTNPGLGQEGQGRRQEQGSGQSVEYNGNTFLMPGCDFSRLEGSILHPSPQSGSGSGRSASTSTRSPNQEPTMIPPPASHSPAATRLAVPATAIPYPTPAPKVAIPRANVSENASHRRRRSARACEPCRQRKVKCDGIRPVCGICVETNTTCQYLDVKRVREQKQLGVLARKVDRYEDLLRELEPESDAGLARKIRRTLKFDEHEPEESNSDDNSSMGSLDAIDLVEEDLNRSERTRATGFFGKNSEVAWMQKLESESNHRYGRTLKDVEQSQEQMAMGRDRAASFVPLTMVSYHLDDLEIPQLERVDQYAVPSRELADRFFDAYMESFHPSFNAVRRKTFTTQYKRFIRQPEVVRPPRKWLAVLNMVFAIGSRYCYLTGEDTGDEDGLVFLARARRLSLAGDMLFQHSDLQQVQVEFLVGFYLLSRGQVNRASKFSNMAFRSALSLGINLRFVDDRTDDAAKEARSRLWWSIYTLEHSIACLTGRVSFATEGLSSVSFPIPYDEEAFGKPGAIRLFQNMRLRRKYLKPTLYQTDLEAHAHGEWLGEHDPSTSLFFYCVVDLVYIVQAVINKVYSIEGVRERSRQIEKRIRKYAVKMDNWLAKVPNAYQFTSLTTGGGIQSTGDEFAREKFKLAMHYYSSKIILYRPCLSHSNSHSNAAPETRARLDSYPSESTDVGSGGSGSGEVGGGEGGGGENDLRTGFRTDMSLSCLRASCALISLLPDEPDIIHLSTLSPWWEHLHCLMQATTALLLGLSNWPTSLPAEEKHSTSATASAPNMPYRSPGDAPVPGGGTNTTTSRTSVPTLNVATVVSNTKKALRWLFHIAVAGHDHAARRAFVHCIGFMRNIAPTVGIDIDDLPEIEALTSITNKVEESPTPSINPGMHMCADGRGTGVGVSEAPGTGPGEGDAGDMQSESDLEGEMERNQTRLEQMDATGELFGDPWGMNGSGSGGGSDKWEYWGGE